MQARGLTAKLSMDNPRIHKEAQLSGILNSERVHLPEYSPDMHKCVEHVFARLKPQVYERLYAFDHHVTAREVQQIIRDLFTGAGGSAADMAARRQAFQQSVLQDSRSLPLTYKVISTDKGVSFMDEHGRIHLGTGGDWPPSAYR